MDFYYYVFIIRIFRLFNLCKHLMDLFRIKNIMSLRFHLKFMFIRLLDQICGLLKRLYDFLLTVI
jgi:hypothetical protein